MKNSLNEIVVLSIFKHLPKEAEITSYIMDSLHLNKRSAYQKIVGDKDFSYDEVVTLSMNLGFSIDKIIEENHHKPDFFKSQNDSSSDEYLSKTYFNMLQTYCDQIENYNKAEQVEIFATLYNLSPVNTITCNYLTRFLYYRWFHQQQNTRLNFQYSDLILPSEMVAIMRKIAHYTATVSDVTCIIDQNTILDTIKEIQYYYRRNLITDAELYLLKEDILNYLSIFERTALTGTNYMGSIYNLYLSNTNIRACTRYINADGKSESQFYVYSINPIKVYDPETCLMHKKWIESQLENSINISRSGEQQFEDFFNKQYEYGLNMDKIMY
jgi:hypothetical protein